MTVDFYDNINKINKDLNVLLNEIAEAQSTFMAEALADNSKKQALTPFQSLQGAMQAFVTILLVCYVMMIGYKMMNGNLSLNMTYLVPIFVDIAIVYYFAMGNAWRDYFFNMILSASKGLGQFAMEVTADYEAKTGDKCNFMDAFYIPKSTTEKCNFPNMSISSDQDRYAQKIVHYSLKDKKPRIGCMRGPFIPRPNYEAVYIPVEYTGISSNYDLTQTQYLQVYCFDTSDSTKRIAATLATNQITGKATKWMCPKGYTMEDGYRASELISLGISDLSGVKSDTYGVVNTSINILDSSSNIINVVKGIVNPELQMLTSTQKYSRTKILESVRANNNIKYRQYPIIQKYGVNRNMDYVGIFDTLDCKVMRYLGYNANNSDDILSIKFLIGALWAGPLGIAIAILTLFIGFLFISMVGRVVQGYLVSIGAITILLYLSPIVMPCMLFPETKGYYSAWIDKIKQYATGIPISLLTIGVMVILTDYIFYGSPAEYDYYSVFKDDGTVNTSCGLIDPANAPLICLFNIMGNAVNSASCVFGSCASIGNNFGKYLGVLILKSLRAIVVLNVIMDSLGKIEDFMGSMLGVSADTTLNGSIFNSSTGLFNQLKARALATMQAPIDMAIDAGKKINTARKEAKSLKQ